MPGRRPVPEIPLSERVKTFKEIQGPVRPQWAVAEARRCLLCEDAPCEKGCPAGVGIVRFVKAIRSQNFKKAIATIRESNVLAGVCARVCPHTSLCEGRCSATDLAEPIAIGVLQRFCADSIRRRPLKPGPHAPPMGVKVAVVGSGPAGIACAIGLRGRGYDVTLFEAADTIGGLMRTAIPPYRLPRDVLDYEVELVESMGIEVRTGERVGDAEALLGDHAAVFVAVGSGNEVRARISGENLEGVLSGLDLLEGVCNASETGGDLPDLGERVAVVGGGNVAIDAARTAVRVGAGSVTIFYRRTEEEMPAWAEEIEAARQEGVEIVFLASPVTVLGMDGHIRALSLQRMELGEPDASGRRRPIPIEGETFTAEADTVVMALGQAGDGLLGALPNTEMHKNPTVRPGEIFSPVPGIFVGGDAACGPSTVVEAVASGRAGAAAIDAYIEGSRD